MRDHPSRSFFSLERHDALSFGEAAPDDAASLFPADLPKRARPSRPLASFAPLRAAQAPSVASPACDGRAYSLRPGAGIEAAIGAYSVPKERAVTSARTLKIRELNDALRTSLTGGEGYFTAEAVAMGPDFMVDALSAVRGFDAPSPPITIPTASMTSVASPFTRRKSSGKSTTTTRRSATAPTIPPTRPKPRASSRSCWRMSIRASRFGSISRKSEF